MRGFKKDHCKEGLDKYLFFVGKHYRKRRLFIPFSFVRRKHQTTRYVYAYQEKTLAHLTDMVTLERAFVLLISWMS